MKKFNPTYKPFGNTAILMEWPVKIDEAIINDIISFEKRLNNFDVIVDTIIAYNSLTIIYKEFKSFNQEIIQLQELYTVDTIQKKRSQKVWEIPVCYDREFGLDLEEVANAKGIATKAVVDLHIKNSYLVYFLGFQPGFLYLGGLDKKIFTPRKSTPRLRVQKGSVGIGGEQTGVYPSDNAGGWNIIGKSPIDFFNIHKEQPCFAKAGDRIQFFSIDVASYYSIEEAVKKGKYQLKFREF